MQQLDTKMDLIEKCKYNETNCGRIYLSGKLYDLMSANKSEEKDKSNNCVEKVDAKISKTKTQGQLLKKKFGAIINPILQTVDDLPSETKQISNDLDLQADPAQFAVLGNQYFDQFYLKAS